MREKLAAVAGPFPEAGQLGPFASTPGGPVNSSPPPTHPPLAVYGREDAMFGLIKDLFSDESGATAVEYGLMVALIAVLCIGAVTFLGGKISGTFDAAGKAIAS